MSILDAALGYIESSPQWPCFPLVPPEVSPERAKRPPFKTGTDHAEGCSSDPAVIRAWFTGRYRGYWLGMPTGAASGTVVIDVDAKYDGEALLAVLEGALGPLPRTRVVRTRSGGLHIYCAHPGVRVRSGAKGGQLAKLLGGVQGVDVRADGGLVVLPPSPGYTWIADDDERLPALPKMWLAAINGAGDPPRVTTTVAMPEISDERKLTRARAYLARMPEAIEHQGGHDSLWAAVLAMRCGFDLDEQTTRWLIASDYNPRCNPPWSDEDIEHKLAQVDRAKRRDDRGYLLRDVR